MKDHAVMAVKMPSLCGGTHYGQEHKNMTHNRHTFTCIQATSPKEFVIVVVVVIVVIVNIVNVL